MLLRNMIADCQSVSSTDPFRAAEPTPGEHAAQAVAPAEEVEEIRASDGEALVPEVLLDGVWMPETASAQPAAATTGPQVVETASSPAG